MQLFFIDESGTIPPKNKIGENGHFALGGIIIPEDIWYEVDSEFYNLKQYFKIKGEIKWRYFTAQENFKHSLSHLSAIDKETLRENIYKIIVKFKSIKLISCITDVKQSYTLDHVFTHNDLYWGAYQKMTISFQEYLEEISITVGNRINGIIICDNRQPKDDYLLRHLHQELISYPASNFVYKNLIEGLFIAPSHLSIGIQFADMVAGAVYRKFVKRDSRYFDQIAEAFKINGLLEWPKN